MWHLSQYTPDNDTLAEKFFQEATDLDPAVSGAYGGLAMAQGQAPALHSPGQPETTNSVEALVRRAIALDGADAEARSLLSNALWRRADFEGARAEAERALAMTPNLASAHDMLGATLIFSGRPKEGIAALEKSIRLDPREPRLAHRLNRLALGLYFTREYAAAVEVANRAIRSYPDFPLAYRWLAAALGQLGQTEEARKALEKAIAISPTSSDMYVRDRVPWMRPEDHAHMLEGLRKAGWEG